MVDRSHTAEAAQGLLHLLHGDAAGHRIHRHNQRLLQQLPAAPGHRQAHADGGDCVEASPAGELHQQGTHQHRRRHRGIGEQVHHSGAAVEIVAVVAAEQTGREEIHHNAGRRRPGHGPAHQLHRLAQPLQPLHHHHRRRHHDQHGIHQRRQLGGAAVAIGEALVGGPATQPFGPPAQQQAGHIAKVVHRIPHQGQGAEGEPDRQLEPGEGAVEHDAPAEGRRRAGAMLMLPGVGLALDRHGRMGAVGVVAAARRPMTMTGMIRPARGRLERGHRGRRSGGREVTGRPPFLPNAAVQPRDCPPGSDCRRAQAHPRAAAASGPPRALPRSWSAGDPFRHLPAANPGAADSS